MAYLLGKIGQYSQHLEGTRRGTYDLQEPRIGNLGTFMGIHIYRHLQGQQEISRGTHDLMYLKGPLRVFQYR